MKRIILTLAFTAMAVALKAQSGNTIAQPSEVIGKRINAAGEVTKEYEASFTYTPDGKVDRFDLPEYVLYTRFYYNENNCITEISTRHNPGLDGNIYSGTRYTYYEDGKLMRTMDYDIEELAEYKTYTYREDGRLARVDYAHGWPDEIYAYSLFEYENAGLTRIESHYGRLFLTSVTTRQYDDTYTLVSEQTDNYYSNGVITSSTRTLYTYTLEGDPETVVTQNLTEGEWVNNRMHIYIYDENRRVVEQQDGIWSEELGDWNIFLKSVHELSNNGLVYTVSFYKKSGGEWVWDVFRNHELFFKPELKMLSTALVPFSNEPYIGSANINQFEFHMIYTERPTYMKVGEDSAPVCTVYPNPGNGQVRIEAPVEDCVVRFYDLNGRLILAKPFDFATDVATDNWTPGLYLWEIWNGAQRQASGKWVKE